MVAIHTPTETGFELAYNPDCLLRSIQFLRGRCDSAAREWKEPRGRSWRSLFCQIAELYLNRW